jgi:predicted dehydrogenase
MATAKVGLVGCGNISSIYLKNCPKFDVPIVACADVDAGRAEARAAEFGLRAVSVEQLLADPEIEIVLNLTVPNAHAEVNLAALNAGKHVYTEKPLAVSRADGERTLALAQAKGLRVGAAPDTFLGAGLQTCRRLMDEGAIGVPVAFSAFMGYGGPETWHPNPHFFYQPGAGPMFDMGPYYLTALIHLLGPARRVTGSARITYPERVAAHESIRGQKIPVNTPTHVIGVMEMASGPIGTVVTTFDAGFHQQPNIEIYGSEGTLSVPDPNSFNGPVRVRHPGESAWRELPLTHPHAENSRGLGVADLARAIRENRPHRASGQLALHVLDLMHAFHDAAREGRHLELTSGPDRPAALAVDEL